MLLFLILVFWSSLAVSAEECECRNTTYEHDHILEDVHESLSRMILCCIPAVRENSNATITWTFEGVPLEQTNLTDYEKRCNGRNLYLTKASGQGHYTCSITNKDGTKNSFTTKLKVHPSEKFRNKPNTISVTDDVYALEGEPARFTCLVSLDKVTDFYWTLPDGQLKFYESETTNNDDVLSLTVEIKSVTKDHYGTYECIAMNSFGFISKNASLYNGVSPSKKVMNNWKLCLVVGLIIAFTALWLLYCSWRCRWTLRAFYNEKFASKSVEAGYWYDVFIVHGSMATNWVTEVLLPTLENTYGYICFVPYRDMLGGEQYAEAISQAMTKSSRALVVISPCLLQSTWAKWALHSGINTCLTTQARILGITLQAFGNNMVTSENTGLLKSLQMIKRIKVPRSCGLQKIGEEPQITSKEEEGSDDRNSSQEDQFKLSIPESMGKGSGSHPSKNQCLTNMITESNHASREKLDKHDDPKMNDQKFNTVYTESNGLEDPGTPCSITPFILPAGKKSYEEDQETCGSAFTCMSLTCCGDPEIMFWQEVRIGLDLPSVRQRHITEETIA